MALETGRSEAQLPGAGLRGLGQATWAPDTSVTSCAGWDLVRSRRQGGKVAVLCSWQREVTGCAQTFHAEACEEEVTKGVSP